MKTTVEIPDALFAEAKSVAQRRGIPLRRLIEDGLRATVRKHGVGRSRFHLKDGSFGGDGPVNEMPWPEVRSIIYKGRGE